RKDLLYDATFTTSIYTPSLHDALPILRSKGRASIAAFVIVCSPPTIIGILSAATSSDQTEVTLFKVSWLSSTVSISPISCTGTFSRSTSDRILYSSRFADTSRMAPGPKRDPALYVLLLS